MELLLDLVQLHLLMVLPNLYLLLLLNLDLVLLPNLHVLHPLNLDLAPNKAATIPKEISRSVLPVKTLE
jgi:hypothetical protein